TCVAKSPSCGKGSDGGGFNDLIGQSEKLVYTQNEHQGGVFHTDTNSPDLSAAAPGTVLPGVIQPVFGGNADKDVFSGLGSAFGRADRGASKESGGANPPSGSLFSPVSGNGSNPGENSKQDD